MSTAAAWAGRTWRNLPIELVEGSELVASLQLVVSWVPLASNYNVSVARSGLRVPPERWVWHGIDG